MMSGLEDAAAGKLTVPPPPMVRVMETSKKMSPLKHVSPILKKYNSQRHAKTARSKSKKIPSQPDMSSPMRETRTGDVVVSPLCLEVPCEPFDVMQDSDCFKDQLSSPGQAHSMLTESFSGDPLETSTEEITEHALESVAASKDDPSSRTNQTPKISRLSYHERKRNRFIKKRNRIQKDLEHSLPLIAADERAVTEEKSFSYAMSFFLKTKERLSSDEATFVEFVMLLIDFESGSFNVVDLYHRVTALLSPYPDLCEEFLGFLLPEQALHCGRFMEHLSLMEMMSFLRKLEVFFMKQPQHLRKIYSSWATLSEVPSLTLEEVRSTIIPLMRGNKLLEDSFMELLPGAAPPESKLDYGGGTDVEQLYYEDIDSELSDEDERPERIEIPGGKSDKYGGEHCQCCCHESEQQPYASRSKHCVPCGIKFIGGKVYLQTEQGLRPVRVNFGGDATYSNHLKRLNSDPRKLQRQRGPKRGCGKTPSSRPNNSANTITTTASATGTGSGTGTGIGTKDDLPNKGPVKPAARQDDLMPTEMEDESVLTSKSKSPRSQRPKTMPSRSKEKPAPTKGAPQTTSRTKTNPKVKAKMSIFPPAATYDEIALPAPEPTANKSDAIDFSALSDVLRQERLDQELESGRRNSEDSVIPEKTEPETDRFPVGSEEDSAGAEPVEVREQPEHVNTDSTGAGSDVEDMDGDAMSDLTDVSEGAPDPDSDDAMSVDSFVESENDADSREADTVVDAAAVVDSLEAEGSVVGEGDESGRSQATSEESSSEPIQAWTREEDRIILQAFQGEPDVKKIFTRLSQLLPTRSGDEIKGRFNVLMKLIQQLT